MIVGLVVIFWTCCDFGDLRNLWRFLGLLRGGKHCYLDVDHSFWDTHTTSGWTWAQRAREPMEVSWARDYFVVGREVNLVGFIKRSIQ